MKSRIAPLALVLVSVTLALIAAEAGLRFFFHAAPQLDLDIFRKEDGLLSLRPNLERRHVTRYWDVMVRTNSEGWRDEGSEVGGSTVLGLGDSLAFGWGVEENQSFYALAERAIGRSIVNVAVPGSATIDQERLLERLIPRYRPQLVLLAFFVGNDFTETGLGGAERLDVVDGLLSLKPLDGQPAPSSWVRQLARRSHLLQTLRAVQFRVGGGVFADGQPRSWDAWMREFAQVHLRRPSPGAQESIRLTLESLDRIAERCREDRSELALLVLPRSFQVDEVEGEEMRTALGLLPEELDMHRPQRILRAWADGANVLSVDLLEDFRARQKAGARLYYSPDAHLTAAGHAAVAAALANALTAQANL